MTGLRSSATTFFPYRHHLGPRDKVGSFHSLAAQKASRDFEPRTTASMQSVYNEAVRRYHGGETAKQIKDYLDQFSLHVLENAFWSMPMDKAGVYRAGLFDVLHDFDEGIVKMAIEVCWECLEDSFFGDPQVRKREENNKNR